MRLKDQDHSSGNQTSFKVRIKRLVAGMGIAIAAASAIEIFLAVKRKKKAKNKLLDKEAI